MAYLLFILFAYVELGSISFAFKVKSKPVQQEVSCTVILPLDLLRLQHRTVPRSQRQAINKENFERSTNE